MKRYEIIDNEGYYHGLSLTSLAKKYGTPLKITFLDVITEHVTELKNSFNEAINETGYRGKFIYLNANKANYGRLEIEAAMTAADGLETSSYYDLLLSMRLLKKHKMMDKYLVSNGYKPDDYLGAIKEAHLQGYKIIDIIDSVDEYERLKAMNLPIEIGLRMHMQSMYAPDGVVENDRFGLMEDEFYYIIDDLKNSKLVLTTIHFHQRGFDYDEAPFLANLEKAFVKYYVKAYQQISTVANFNMGGGTPLPLVGDFDYVAWAKLTLNKLMELSKEHKVAMPNLFSENGKFSQKDSTVNVYKVITKKHTADHPWYIVDSSLLIALPEMYALGEPIMVTPINELDKPLIKGKLAGVTCDCDDVFPMHEEVMDLPDTDNELYIGLIGTGSYQNSMNGKGGIHHCLLPEEIDLVVKGKKMMIRKPLQSFQTILKIMK